MFHTSCAIPMGSYLLIVQENGSLVVQICHWSGQCLTLQEALKFQFETQALTPYENTAAPRGSSSGLSHREKVAIMLSMGGLLLLISIICAWLLLRNRKGARSSSRQHGAGAIAQRVVRTRWGGVSRSGTNSGTCSMQLSESELTPKSTVEKPCADRSMHGKPKKSPLKQSHTTPIRPAAPSDSFTEPGNSGQPFLAVHVDTNGCPTSL